MSMRAEALNSDTKGVSDLDEIVGGVLTAEHRAFESVVVAVGGAADAKAVRESLLRLRDAGKAELTHGLGWRRAGAAS